MESHGEAKDAENGSTDFSTRSDELDPGTRLRDVHGAHGENCVDAKLPSPVHLQVPQAFDREQENDNVRHDIENA